VIFHPERLRHPYGWKKPRKVFVNSMSDLFHEKASDNWIAQGFQGDERFTAAHLPDLDENVPSEWRDGRVYGLITSGLACQSRTQQTYIG
jgi:hypothetical protein